MLTQILKKASEHIGARVHPALKHIIQAEVKARNLADDTDFLKIAILSNAVSEESRRIMREEMLDPMMQAMMQALGVQLPALPAAMNDAPPSSSARTAEHPVVEIVKYGRTRKAAK